MAHGKERLQAESLSEPRSHPPRDETPAPVRLGVINHIGTAALYKREIKREFALLAFSIGGPVVQTILFAIVFHLAAGGSPDLLIRGVSMVAFIAPGLVVSASLQRSYEVNAFSLMEDRMEGTLQDLLMAPLRPIECMAVYAASPLTVGGIVGAFIWLVMFLFTDMVPVHTMTALLFLAGGMIAVAYAGIIAAIFSWRWDSLSGKEIFILTPLIFLSGTFFPMEAVAEPFRTILQFNPIYHVVEGFRYGMTGASLTDPLLSGCVVAGSAALMALTAYVLFARGYRLKS